MLCIGGLTQKLEFLLEHARLNCKRAFLCHSLPQQVLDVGPANSANAPTGHFQELRVLGHLNLAEVQK